MRYSDRPFPAYRYRPGSTPHPTRSPAGHSFGLTPPEVMAFDASRWRACDEYLFGVDLFNHGYWWEAHEAWEPLWKAAGRRATIGLFLQGLIQISVACLKREQGQDHAAERLAGDGSRKIALAGGGALGIDTRELTASLQAYLAGRTAKPPTITLIDRRTSPHQSGR